MGGGLGAAPSRTPSPVHAPQGTTWPGTLGPSNATCTGQGVPNSCCTGAGTGTCDTTNAVFTPPTQADRVRSFGTEVAEGASAQLVWNSLRPGTYLIESGTQPSIQGSMGLYGMLVVTEPDDTSGASPVHVAYGTKFDTAVPLLLGEIDPEQNAAVATAVNTTLFDATLVWNGQAGQCGDLVVHTCYPPAVNYSPRYFLINGGSFDATVPAASSLGVPAAGAQKSVMLRLVNAGLRMHVPSITGAPMTLVAEDGNKLPGNPRKQNEVFLAAGKTHDVTIQPKQTTAGTYDAATYAVFDRALGMSTNNQLDGGMQAYLQVAGGALPATGTTLSASDKTYYCVAGTTLAITDPSKGLLAGAVGANGVGAPTAYSGQVSATNLSVQSSGTFTYAQLSTATTCGGTFQYKVNGSQTHTATIAQCDVNSSAAAGCSLASAPVVANVQFMSNIATRYVSGPPGVLAGVTSNPSGFALTAVGTATGVVLNPDGSFVATSAGATACGAGLNPPAPSGASCVAFQYQAKNAQGTASNAATATVVFLPASNLALTVKDAKTGLPVNDYRWIIEEDRTFWVDPKCQVNSTDPALRPSTCPPLPVESIGYSFHTANMPVVAQGCVGAVSCEAGQTLGGTPAVCDVGNGVCRTDGAQQTEIQPGAVHLDPSKRYFVSVLPGDGVNPTIGGAGGPDDQGHPFSIDTACGPYVPDTSLSGSSAWAPGGANAMCGHAMGGAQIPKELLAATGPTVTIKLQQTPLPTAKIAV